MTERQRQTEFLKELIEAEDCDVCKDLQARIFKAEADEHCIRSAMSRAVTLALLSLLGLGYAIVLAPENVNSGSTFTVKVLTVLFLASSICLVGFIGFLHSCRRVTNQLYNECRQFIRLRRRSEPTSVRTTVPPATNTEPTDFPETQPASEPLVAQTVGVLAKS